MKGRQIDGLWGSDNKLGWVEVEVGWIGFFRVINTLDYACATFLICSTALWPTTGMIYYEGMRHVQVDHPLSPSTYLFLSLSPFPSPFPFSRVSGDLFRFFYFFSVNYREERRGMEGRRDSHKWGFILFVLSAVCRWSECFVVVLCTTSAINA